MPTIGWLFLLQVIAAFGLAAAVLAIGRHTAVSIISSNGVPIQEISDTVGHKSTHVTETVYRHVIVPEIRGGATVMDGVFSDDGDDTDEGNERTENG
jgi:integrase